MLAKYNPCQPTSTLIATHYTLRPNLIHTPTRARSEKDQLNSFTSTHLYTAPANQANHYPQWHPAATPAPVAEVDPPSTQAVTPHTPRTHRILAAALDSLLLLFTINANHAVTDGRAPRAMTSATIRTAIMSIRRIRVGTIQHQGQDDEACMRRGLARIIMVLCAWLTRSFFKSWRRCMFSIFGRGMGCSVRVT